MAKEKVETKKSVEKPIKQKKSFIKRLFTSLIVIISIIVVAIGGVFAYGYFKHDINPFTLIGSANKINSFSQDSITLNNKFSAEDLASANFKVDNHDFSENLIYFTDKEIAAKINEKLSTEKLDYNVKLLQLTFSNYEDYEDNILTTLNFTLNLNTEELKSENFNKFPVSLISSKIPNDIVLNISTNLIENSDKTYSSNYVSIQANNLTIAETENMFRLLELVSKNLSAKAISEKLGNSFADKIIGNTKTEGIYTKLQQYGAKGYLFNKQGNDNCFSIFAHTVDEERFISYSNTKGLENPNLTVYTLKNGVITLQPLELLGYNFLGWFDESNNKVEQIKTVQMLNYVLSAKWELVEYTITYVLKGGTVAEPGNPTSYTIESDDITLIKPTKTDDIFVGWSGTILAEETKNAVIPKGTTGNLTFVAHYEFDEVYMTLCVDGVDIYTHEYPNGTVLTEESVYGVFASDECGMTGYSVDKWYSNESMTTEYTFGNVIKRDFTIYGSANYFVKSPLNQNNLKRFINALSTKELEINDHDDLVSWVFFVMFYNVKSDVQVKLYLPSSIATTTAEIKAEINSAINDVKTSSTYQGVLSYSYNALTSGGKTYGLVYVSESVSDKFATKTLNSTGYLLNQQDSAPKSQFVDTRTDSYNAFKVNNIGRSMEVTNSEQLVYALEMGFKPICKAGSAAENVYNKAKTVLKDICSDEMSDTDKLFAIYTWLVLNVNYDYLAYNQSTTNIISAEKSREYDSWFADGVFNNGKAVCEGYAKALLIMARIENIPCIYVTGNNHAWNKVFINGNWYGIDATHGDMADKENNYEILSYTEFLFTDAFKLQSGYTTTDHQEITATTVFNFYDYFTLSNGVDFKIDNTSELNALVNYIASLPKNDVSDCITFECILSSSISTYNVQTQLMLKGLSYNACYSIQSTPTGDVVYLFYINIA